MNLLAGIVARRAYFVVALVVLALDQTTKILAHAHLRGRAPVEIIPNFFDLAYSRNRGGLFGYFGDLGDPWRTALLTVLPVVAIALVVAFLAKSAEVDRRTLFGLGLILGGAVGNLVDRVARGEVVDFFDAYASNPRLADWFVARFGTAHWPTFNVADSAIVTGAGLLLWTLIHPPRGPATATPADRHGET